jgi:hypothetical protein
VVSRFNLLLTAAAVMLSLLLAWLWFFHSPYEPLAIDFRVLHRVGGENYSDLYQNGGMSPFVYPPSSIMLFSFFNLAPFWAGFWGWAIASAAAFFFACRALWDWRIAALSLLSVASFQGLFLGQPAMMLAALILAAFALPDDWKDVRGFALGIVLAIKPQLVTLAPLAFVVRGERLSLLWMAIGSGVLIAQSVLLYGIQTWLDWLNALPLFRYILFVEYVLDHTITPAGKAEHLGYPSLIIWLLAVAISCAAVIQSARKLERGQLAGLIVAASLMASPYALPHDTLTLIPACLSVLLTLRDWRVLPALSIFVGWLTAPALFALWLWSISRSAFPRAKSPIAATST